MSFSIVFVNLFLVLLISSCGPKHPSKDGGQVPDEGSDASIAEKLNDPTKIIFADVEKFVLSKSCHECHSGSRIEADIDLTTFDNLFGKDSRKSVVPFNPARSLVYETLIVPSGGRHMPPFNKKN